MVRTFEPQPLLGPLETTILQAITKLGSATVRELQQKAFQSARYTTLMTTVTRLYQKGILSRTSERRAFRYFPRQNEDELRTAISTNIIRALFESYSKPAELISQLVDAIDDPAKLDELQQAIERKRRDGGQNP